MHSLTHLLDIVEAEERPAVAASTGGLCSYPQVMRWTA